MMDLIRKEIGRIDSKLAITHLNTFSDLRKLQLFPLEALSALCTFFGILILLLTASGIYGTLSYSINQRMKEIGVRMALGAQSTDVFRLFLGHGVWLTTGGLIAGSILAFWLSPFISSLLFEVSSTDPISFLSSTCVLAVTTLLA